jgi:hypothetical protein
MNEMQQKYGSKGLAIVAVNVDKKRTDADKFLAASGELPGGVRRGRHGTRRIRRQGHAQFLPHRRAGNVVLVERDRRRAADGTRDRIKSLLANR